MTTKKVNVPNKIRTVDQFQFLVNPLSLVFNKTPNDIFFVYIQKGAQVLGKIKEQVQTTNIQYKFIDNHIKKFRIANDKNLIYQWSLYRLLQSQQQQYIQSTNFNLKNRFQDFVKDLQKIEGDLYRIYNEKQKKTQLQQIWKDLRKDLTKNQFEMSCSFEKVKVRINFKMEIKCQYDWMYQKWQQQKQKIRKNKDLRRKSSQESKIKSQQNSFIGSQKQKDKQKSVQSSRNILVKSRKDQSQNKNELLLDKLSVQKDKQNLQPKQRNNQKKTQNKQNKILNNEVSKQSIAIQQQSRSLRESQIKILDPQGVQITQIPQKFLNHKRTIDDDYYTKKKTSMLSDIIQESYEGSSNINHNKSNQGQKLKSVCQLHEQQQTMFSPLVKTQTFQPQKHEQMYQIKRTSTFRHRPSQQFQLQQSHSLKANKKASTSQQRNKMFQYSDIYQTQNQNQQHQQQMQLSEIKKSSTKSSQILERQKQQVENLGLRSVHYMTIKNVVILAVMVLMLVVGVIGMNRMEGKGEGGGGEKVRRVGGGGGKGRGAKKREK